jgi:hypothetical protein
MSTNHQRPGSTPLPLVPGLPQIQPHHHGPVCPVAIADWLTNVNAICPP